MGYYYNVLLFNICNVYYINVYIMYIISIIIMGYTPLSF